MYFDSIAAALEMNGHGPYVWSAYAITAAVVGGLLVSPIRRARSLRQRIQAEQRREQAAMAGGERASKA